MQPIKKIEEKIKMGIIFIKLFSTTIENNFIKEVIKNILDTL